MEQAELLKFTVQALERLGLPYALVGSFASGIWGETRFTQDIDILIELPLDLVSSLCASFPPNEFYVSEPAALDASRAFHQFNVIHPASGNKIDFMVARPGAWNQSQLTRRRIVQLFPDQPAAVAAPEDVILGKLLYYQEGGSEKHLRDIAGILLFSSALIDPEYLEARSKELGVDETWHSLLAKLESQQNS
ncbi:MAG: hypothetical protein IT425_12765 [Pirellulales bacterium]|nr:hypothetical protein [Pirellulales bacterium]